MRADKKKFENVINIKELQNNQRLTEVKNDTSQQEAKFEREIAQKRKDQEFAEMEKELAIQTKYYKPNVLQAMLLDSTNRIYQKLYITNLTVTNVSGMEGGNDSTGKILAQAVAGFKAVDKAIK